MLQRVIFIVLVISLMAIVSMALAGVVSVEKAVEISKGDVVRARQEAISKGLQEAVLINAIKIMKRDPSEEELSILNDRVLKDSTIFVGNYRITKEFTKDNQINITMEVNVIEEPLLDSLTKLGLIQTSDKIQQSNIYRVKLVNVDNYKAYKVLIDKMKNSKGVTELNLVRMSPSTLELEIQSQDALDELVSNVNDGSYQGFKVGVREQTGSEVEFVITEFGQE